MGLKNKRYSSSKEGGNMVKKDKKDVYVILELMAAARRDAESEDELLEPQKNAMPNLTNPEDLSQANKMDQKQTFFNKISKLISKLRGDLFL